VHTKGQGAFLGADTSEFDIGSAGNLVVNGRLKSKEESRECVVPADHDYDGNESLCYEELVMSR
jgi:hypothetical protein